MHMGRQHWLRISVAYGLVNGWVSTESLLPMSLIYGVLEEQLPVPDVTHLTNRPPAVVG